MRFTQLTAGEKPRASKSRLLIVGFLLCAPGAVALTKRGEQAPTTWVGALAAWATRPVQTAVVGGIDGAWGLWNRYVALWQVAADNVALKDKNIRLTAQLRAFEEASAENARLRGLLALREQLAAPDAAAARIIAVSPVPAFRSLRIDRGRAQGVSAGDAVVVPTGLVGRIAAVGEHTADVMLLVDASSSVDALVQRSRARVRVRGEGGDAAFGLDAQYLERTADVEPGDVLVTSGLGHTFPKGLPVGLVRGVERRAFGLYQRAIVQPSVDVTRLEDVLVVATHSPALQVALEASDER